MRPLLLAVILTTLAVLMQTTLVAEETYTYLDDIKPVIDARCLSCHMSWASTYDDLLDESNLVIPGDPDNSRIIWRIEGQTVTGGGITRMPWDGPYLSDDTIAMFRAWIAQGAVEDLVTGVNDAVKWSEIKRLYE